jgi:hypothetical protein
MKLYHYTSLENFWKIWVTKELLFASSRVPSNNDFFERNKSISFGEETDPIDVLSYEMKKIRDYFKVLSQYKQISLTKDYSDGTLGCLSPMMWGLYANKAKGVCIELDSSILLNSDMSQVYHGDILYKNEFKSFVVTEESLQNVSDMDNFILNHKDAIFFQKHIHWLFENEYRIISKCRALVISEAVDHIIVPDYDGNTTQLVRKMVNDDRKLLFLKMDEINGTKKLNCYPFSHTT